MADFEDAALDEEACNPAVDAVAVAVVGTEVEGETKSEASYASIS